MNLEDKERILARIADRVVVDPETGCHLWTGRVNKRGYGEIKIGKQRYTVHRVMMKLHVDDMPPDLYVCHKCDVRHCCNFDHLACGSAIDNMRDKVNKNRHRYKITDEMVETMADLRASGETDVEIARRLGIANSSIVMYLGKAGPASKLMDEDILTVFKLRADGQTYAEIGARFGVDSTTIRSVLNRETWRHIEVSDELLDALPKAGGGGKRGARPGTGKGKLCDDDVVSVYRMRAEGMLHREIAAVLDVSISAITHILNRRKHTHVPIPTEYIIR